MDWSLQIFQDYHKDPKPVNKEDLRTLVLYSSLVASQEKLWLKNLLSSSSFISYRKDCSSWLRFFSGLILFGTSQGSLERRKRRKERRKWWWQFKMLESESEQVVGRTTIPARKHWGGPRAFAALQMDVTLTTTSKDSLTKDPFALSQLIMISLARFATFLVPSYDSVFGPIERSLILSAALCTLQRRSIGFHRSLHSYSFAFYTFCGLIAH